MWMMWIVMGAAVADSQCPPAPVVVAEAQLAEADTAKGVVRHAWLSTDWNYRLATEDRDVVRSELQQARSSLREARGQLRDARQALGDVRRGYTRDELTCEP